MAFATQQNFIGEIDGYTVRELNHQLHLNRDKTKLADRKQVVEEILSGSSFYEEYFDNYFKARINNNDHLSQDNNVCRSLESMATYLLNSAEIKAEEDAEKTQYVFHSDPNTFKRKMDREHSVESMTQTENGGHEESIIHFLKRDGLNHKQEKTQAITEEDYNRTDELGKVLNEYKPLLDFVTSEIKNPGDKKYSRLLLSNIKGQVVNDMITSKDQLLGVFGYNLKCFSESTEPDIDVFDFTNEEHVKGKTVTFIDSKGNEKEIFVKGLMYLKPEFDPSDDFSLVLMDFENTVNKAGLSKEEKYVLDETRDGVIQEEIAAVLGIHRSNVSRTLDRIARKICAVGNKYDGK